MALRVRSTSRLAPLVAVALGCALLTPAPSQASRDYSVEIMDDQIWLGKSDNTVANAMKLSRRLGADRIKVSAFWRDIAPRTNSPNRPRNFNADNPRARGYRWSNLDRVVAFARQQGLGVTISITSPGPLWASRNPAKGRLWDPDPALFAEFSAAVAKRYALLVDRYAIFNEPNQGAWLQPQSVCRRTGRRQTCEVRSPHLYRAIARAAYPRIKAADPGSTILAGELAPSGRDDRGATRPIRPLEFLRLMGCRNRNYQRMRGGLCRRFRPVFTDAIGHHPYSVFFAPEAPSRERDDASLGDTRRLLTTLDRLRAKRALVSSTGKPLDVHYTEYGYQTNPPDPFSGVKLTRQSRWLQEASYMAWANPRVRTLNQFRLVDGALLKLPSPLKYLEFQSGLIFRNGKHKPSYRSYSDPFTVSATRVGRGRPVTLWGQVRPGAGHGVALQQKAGTGWRAVALISTDEFGSFTYTVRPLATATYRFAYADATASGTSDELTVLVR